MAKNIRKEVSKICMVSKVSKHVKIKGRKSDKRYVGSLYSYSTTTFCINNYFKNKSLSRISNTMFDYKVNAQ